MELKRVVAEVGRPNVAVLGVHCCGYLSVRAIVSTVIFYSWAKIVVFKIVVFSHARMPQWAGNLCALWN